MKKSYIIGLALVAATMTTTAYAQDTIPAKDKSDYAAYRHNVQVNVGGGLGSLALPLNKPDFSGKKWILGGGFKLEGMYQYMFSPNWGISAGLGISTLHSAASYSFSYEEPGLIHPDNGREYTSRVAFPDWRERQNVLNFDIPIRGIYVHPLTDKWALEFGAGFTLNVPVYNNFKAKGADYTVTGYFPSTNVRPDYENLPNHGFGNYTAESTKGKNTLTKVNLSGNLDAGALYSIKDNIALYFGLYFGYGFINSVKGSDLPLYAGGNVQQYVGVFQSKEARVAHPVEFGVKLGVRVGMGDRFKKKEPEVRYLPSDTVTLHDTIVRPIIEHDTVVVKEKVKAAENALLDQLLTTANFKTGSYEPIFQEDSEDVFSELKQKMDEDPEAVIVVSGHTDNTGGDERNMELGQQRADAFRNALIKHGIDGKRIYTISYGKEKPVADNDTPEGRAQNRRVELKMK